jgi:Ca2+-binding EF-hand superfamily protein
MKKVLIAILGIACATALTVNAAEGKKKEMTDDQKAVMKEMLVKYDVNKDGKLDKEERAKMTKEDKEKFAKAFPSKKQGEKKDAAADAAKAPAADATK